MAPATAVVVDDERRIVEVVCDVLEEEGIQTAGCVHGYDAYPCIRREHPKVVLLDIQMPQVDGIQVFSMMRADPATATIPVIFLTANAHILQQRLPDYQAQGAELLPKPFHVGKLLDAVNRALGAP